MFPTRLTILPQVLRCIHTSAIRSADKMARERCLNKVTLLGRIGTIDMIGKESNHPFVNMTLATHNYYKSEITSLSDNNKRSCDYLFVTAESEEFTQYTEWHKVKIFKPSLRDTVYIYAASGTRVLVEGELRYRTYTNDSDITTKEAYINAGWLFKCSIQLGKQ
ncbi:Single-stranded DNA-binding protein, mitochondrial [Holothuria leucospilota]|uniref:Single-stranded DNA-binding protein, mitochondrial n=1 Tax=Holothuria leucospilota TaxID=206669 RepID=A0A9Q1H1F9_HOLLE|nr:Single-stranded DNA-binding protein, mitochondrial [Holothuria leucospilota]